MAPRPSSSGISRSIVTRSGTSLWIFLSASSPSLATPTTRNSPEASMISDSTRRKSALSSTTRTVGSSEGTFTGRQGPDEERAVHGLQADGAPGGAAGVLGGDLDPLLLEHLARRHHVPLPHLHRPRGAQVPEHRRPAHEPRGEAGLLGPEPFHLLHQERDRRLRELGRVLGVPAEALV